MSLNSETANVLGAVSLALHDHFIAAGCEASGQSASAVAALSALHQFLDQPTLDQLRTVLGLTSSGTVRLVDRLAEDGLVTRGPGRDKRSRAVLLTEKGQAIAETVVQARLDVLGTMLDTMTADEQRTFHHLLSKVTVRIVQEKDGGAWVCRLCNLEACGQAKGHCPAANAAAEKYGAPKPGPGFR